VWNRYRVTGDAPEVQESFPDLIANIANLLGEADVAGETANNSRPSAPMDRASPGIPADHGKTVVGAWLAGRLVRRVN
jgi:hypothetical protein